MSAPDGPDPSSGSEDPLAADRRTLVVAVVAVVVLVSIGVVSASLFARSACEVLELGPLPAPATAEVPETVLASAFEDADEATHEAMADVIAALESEFGALIGITDVSGADQLARLPGAVAATGEIVVRLAADGGDPRAVDVDEGEVVGDGAALYSLAVGNELTGQVDAFFPLDAQLEPGSCVDTAVVGTPFAFLLDAGDGELLLFRSEEDASTTEVELRGPAGPRWATAVALETAPPGVLGERLAGALTPDLAVVVTRTSPDDETPVVTALQRGSGRVEWTVSREELVGIVSDDAPQSSAVVVVDDEQVIVELRREADGDREEAAAPVIVALDAADGEVLWSEVAVPTGPTLDGVIDSSGRVLVAFEQGEEIVAQAYGPEGRSALVNVPGEGRGLLVARPAGGELLVTDRLAVPLEPRALRPDRLLLDPFEPLDVLVDEDTTTWLLGGPQDDGAVAVTFGG